eukprot:3811006-Pyramimonas_sp.AAC.1
MAPDPPSGPQGWHRSPAHRQGRHPRQGRHFSNARPPDPRAGHGAGRGLRPTGRGPILVRVSLTPTIMKRKPATTTTEQVHAQQRRHG